MAVACPSARMYARRVPEATVLYRVVQQHFGEFLAPIEAGDRGGRLPAFVTEEFEVYLGCGLLSRGCLHVRCEQCGDEMVVAFSGKGRFCPSCGGRRMTELAAQLVDRVIPDVPVRQWVLSLPWSLRYQLAGQAEDPRGGVKGEGAGPHVPSAPLGEPLAKASPSHGFPMPAGD